jgi:acetate---CoA ligase (ADP-forming)
LRQNHELDFMLSPKSITIIGASGNPRKISSKPVFALKSIGYKGDVYLVNPKYTEIAGYPCFKDIDSLPMDIDLAIISVNSSEVKEILEKLSLRKIKSAVLFSSGYSESGEEGARLEKELTQFSKEKGIPICGPNSLGITNVKDKVVASFSSLEAESADPIAFITQSGAIGSLTYTLAQEMGFGYQYFVSSGNEASVDFFDYVQYFANKEDVKVIGGYLEGARDYKKMEDAIDTCHSSGKPLVLMKVGNSEKGAEAASSHTASLAGNAQVYKSYLIKKNVVRVSDEEELTDTLNIFTKTKKPQKPRGVALITMSGGAGIIMADQCEKSGIELAKLSDKTSSKLKQLLPKFASIKNPIDVTAQITQTPVDLVEAVNIILEDENVESLVLYMQMMDDKFLSIIPDLGNLAKETKKIFILSWSGIKPSTKQLLFEQKEICWIPNPSRAIKSLENVVKYYRNLQAFIKREKVSRITEAIQALQLNGTLNEWKSKMLLKRYGVNTPIGGLIQSETDLGELVNRVQFPIVMKVVSKEIEHKSDFGLVKLNIENEQEALSAYQEIIKNKIKYCNDAVFEGVLIEEMAPKGIEVIIGAVKDPVFGPCIMFGLGGIFVEILKDVVVLPAPLTKADAHYMIKSINGYSILQGTRGKTNYDINSLVDNLVRISEFCIDYQDQLVEFDINPLIVHQEGQGVTAVDGLIVGKNV